MDESEKDDLNVEERWTVYRAIRQRIDPLDGKIWTAMLMVLFGLVITAIMAWFVLEKIMQGIHITPSF